MAPSKHAIFTIYKSLSGGAASAGGVCSRSRSVVAPLERLETSLQGSKCARIVPNSAVKFFSNDQASRGNVVSKPLGLDDNNNSALSVNMRLDAIRPRMQMAGWSNASSTTAGEENSKVPVEYSVVIDAFRGRVQNEGFGALPRGLVPNSVKVVPSRVIFGRHLHSSTPREREANLLRPLSPHLPVYKPQVSSTVSISNRISASFLSVLFLSSSFVCLEMSQLCLTYGSFNQFLFYSSKLVPISLELAALATAFHLFYGVRDILRTNGVIKV
ncbi:hypothetical protein MKX01_007739 [Papaver californicum]|nr:hypothetical protein MKX01_007739 [Papaver californicum]